MPTRRPVPGLAVVALLALLIAGCSHDTGQHDQRGPTRTAPTRPGTHPRTTEPKPSLRVEPTKGAAEGGMVFGHSTASEKEPCALIDVDETAALVGASMKSEPTEFPAKCESPEDDAGHARLVVSIVSGSLADDVGILAPSSVDPNTTTELFNGITVFVSDPVNATSSTSPDRLGVLAAYVAISPKAWARVSVRYPARTDRAAAATLRTAVLVQVVRRATA